MKKSLYVPKSDNTYKVYIQGNAIQKDETLGEYYISEEYFHQKLERFEVHAGDYIITCDGTLGKFLKLSSNIEKGVISSSLLLLKLNEEIIYDKYFELLWEYSILKLLASRARNACLVHLSSAKEIGNVEILLPDIEKQKETADLLFGVVSICSHRKQQLAKLDELVKARFVEMFGDPFLNSFNWRKLKIKDAVTVEPQNGLYKPQSDYVDNGTGTPILRIDGFYNGKIVDFSKLKRLICSDDEKKKYLLEEDDIVINRVNSIEHLGKCAHIKGLLEETVFESNMMRMHFDIDRFSPIYVTYLLCSPFIYDQILNHAKKAVNQASINQKDVLDFDIYNPPIDLQQQFADFVEKTDKSKLAVQKSLDEAQLLFDSLMQEYFG